MVQRRLVGYGGIPVDSALAYCVAGSGSKLSPASYMAMRKIGKLSSSNDDGWLWYECSSYCCVCERNLFLYAQVREIVVLKFHYLLTEAAPATATSSASAPATPVIDKESLDSSFKISLSFNRSSTGYCHFFIRCSSSTCDRQGEPGDPRPGGRQKGKGAPALQNFFNHRHVPKMIWLSFIFLVQYDNIRLY